MGPAHVVAVPDGVVNTLDHGYQNFPNIQEPLKILDAIIVTGSNFHTEDPQILTPPYKMKLPGDSAHGICVALL